MDHDSKPVQKFLIGTALSAALVALGLGMTGNSARALNSISADAHVEGFHVFDNATQTVEEVVLNGRPTQVLVCHAPRRTPQEVLAHYRNAAEGETRVGVPYLLQETPYGGSVMWVTLDGARKSAMVGPDPRGGARFRLICEPSLQSKAPRRQRGDSDTVLPGGISVPEGYDVTFCMNDGAGVGTAVLEAPGSCRDAAAGLLSELSSRGFAAEADALSVFEAQAAPNRLTLPFRHHSGAMAGHVTVSRTETGSRLCLTVRQGK